MNAADPDAVRIDLAREFSPTPLGRFRKQGRFSGEAFREDHLWRHLKDGRRVIVNLDGATGLSTGFLDEAFAGLVREKLMSEEQFWERVEIICTRDPYVLTEIRTFVSRAARQAAAH